MSDEILRIVLDRCYSIAKTNETEYVYDRLCPFVKRNIGRLIDEAKVERSEKRRTYGNYEGQLANLFIELCGYRCTQANRDGVNKIMSIIGYAGYSSSKARFRQRMENYLKNSKTKKRVMKGSMKKKRTTGGHNGHSRADKDSDDDYEYYLPSEVNSTPEDKTEECVAPASSLVFPLSDLIEPTVNSAIPDVIQSRSMETETEGMLSPTFSYYYDNLHNNECPEVIDDAWMKDVTDSNNRDTYRSYGFSNEDIDCLFFTADDFDEWRLCGLMDITDNDDSKTLAYKAQKCIDHNKSSAVKTEEVKDEAPIDTTEMAELKNIEYEGM